MLSNLDPQAPRTVVTGTNWRGMWTLYNREVHRYLKIFGQTLLAPIITMLLFLIVFGVVFGGERRIGGLTYLEFLAPGLLMMAILQNAFANTSTSIISQKINECIVDSLMPPLSAMELTIGFVLGGATRGLMVAIGVGATLVLITPISFHHPFIIILTVPLAVFGGLVFIQFLNTSINIFSQIALVILIGISTKNSILIVDYANQLRTKGKEIEKAVKEACSLRFRPIIMTSLSTMIAMIPLVIGNIGPGAGEGSRLAVGATILGGMIISTFFTLYVTPTMYLTLAKNTKRIDAVDIELKKQLN